MTHIPRGQAIRKGRKLEEIWDVESLQELMTHHKGAMISMNIRDANGIDLDINGVLELNGDHVRDHGISFVEVYNYHMSCYSFARNRLAEVLLVGDDDV